MPDGYDVHNGWYLDWCVDEDTYIYNHHTYDVTLRSSYDTDLPDYLKDSDWDKVNYIINHKGSADKDSVQNAIWYFIDHGAYSGFPGGDPEADDLIDEAKAHGGGYEPQPAQLLAVILDAGENTLWRSMVCLTR